MKIISVICVDPWVHDFLIFCMTKMGSTYNALELHPKVKWLPQGHLGLKIIASKTNTCAILKAILSTKHHFYLEALLTEKLWFLRLGFLAAISPKINKVRLSLQGRQLTAFFSFCQLENSSLQVKIKSFSKLASATMSLTAFQNTFLLRSMVRATNVMFLYCIMDYVNI